MVISAAGSLPLNSRRLKKSKAALKVTYCRFGLSLRIACCMVISSVSSCSVSYDTQSLRSSGEKPITALVPARAAVSLLADGPVLYSAATIARQEAGCSHAHDAASASQEALAALLDGMGANQQFRRRPDHGGNDLCRLFPP